MMEKVNSLFFDILSARERRPMTIVRISSLPTEKLSRTTTMKYKACAVYPGLIALGSCRSVQ